MKQNRRQAKKAPAGKSARAVVKSFLLTLLLSFSLLLVLSLVLSFAPDPDSYILPSGLIISALSAFFGGMIAKKTIKESPAVCGLVNGMLLCAFLLLLSVLFKQYAHGFPLWLSPILYTSVILLSLLGTAVKSGTPKKRIRAKRR